MGRIANLLKNKPRGFNVNQEDHDWVKGLFWERDGRERGLGHPWWKSRSGLYEWRKDKDWKDFPRWGLPGWRGEMNGSKLMPNVTDWETGIEDMTPREESWLTASVRGKWWNLSLNLTGGTRVWWHRQRKLPTQRESLQLSYSFKDSPKLLWLTFWGSCSQKVGTFYIFFPDVVDLTHFLIDKYIIHT